ncbi:prepilin peptidase [Clostridium grantii]|uniref:Type 4 prepilin peptidase 1. Aspartic peptidase. MEROPS family A24A n=1 Tax=Clostridium grantii DSM 8605 TaxID=1121316 RepID=A0A1M5RIG7_9CLOT|nr:A24 family peptidase [Clostridium grantii]SHH25859.1 type 4 prepilin peptidase 1 . Aspartic peptidase. MEROPS family A24A [Clostridium grantii DSM 8605]
MDFLFVFIYGLVFGSFFNVCIYRIPRQESIAYPPSHCTSCGKKLKAVDLFPVLSWVFLKGKCRYCGDKISIKYPLFEILTGIIFVLVYKEFGYSIETIKFLVFASYLIIVGFIDLNTTDVYFSTTLFGLITGIIFVLINVFLGNPFLTYIYGAAFGAGIITLIILTTHGMGWGDVEILGICGLFLGFKLSIVTFFFSALLAGIIGMILILSKIKSRKDYIAFGPYIALAAFLLALYWDKFFQWYLALII